MSGPAPNRSEDHSRERDANRGNKPPITNGEMRPVLQPEPNPDWHHVSRMMWDAMGRSGQEDFYQESDWAYAYVACELLSEVMNKEVRQGRTMMAQTVISMLNNLLITEADRRRARIELQQPVPVEEPISMQVVRDMRAQLMGD